MESINTEALVIGAGPGGYVAAIKLAQFGLSTVVVEKENIGGTCLNVGCIPSKALIHVAKNFAHCQKDFQKLGIIVDNPKLDFEKSIAWKDGIINRLSKGIESLLKAHKVQLLKGEASFQNENTVLLKKTDGTQNQINFKHCILATGSVPSYPPFLQPDGQYILDSSHLLALKKIPAKLVIVGGGYIGMELGMVFAKLGSEVTVVEFLDSILAGFDADIIKLLERRAKQLKMKIMLNSKAVAVEKGEQTKLIVEQKGQSIELFADHVFVSIGRRPYTENLNLAAIGLKTNEKGFLESDECLRTGLSHIYSIGDLRSQPMLAHKASKEAEIAAAHIAGQTAESYGHIPAVVFTDPEIASCGLSEKEAMLQSGHTCTSFPFAAIGRTMTTGEIDGFIKMICQENGQIVGITIVGPAASDLISEALIIIEKKLTARELAGLIHPHPTFGEIFMECAKAAIGEPIHIIKQNPDKSTNHPANKSNN